ncbi:hypothetical protein [Williamsia deligens]|uniref:Transmembrane protein n=1 Tax=Williamsia deligens TaxID=321325 RepID=A0ABW3G7W6_9NOCA|nr:hypothetical protein [Williamsia deligens]MCP2194427.1 hypothetical protein [Williamsia deligens]
MAREPDPDSRPISVAEILARRAAEDASDAAPSGGRRRRGSEGSVSFAELTGEIPRIRGGAHSGQFRAIDRSEVEAAGGVADEITEDAPSTDTLAARSGFVPDEPQVTEDQDADRFPRSERPVAPEQDAAFPRSESPQPGAGRRAAWSAPTDQPPATRDLNSADVRERFSRPGPPAAPERDDEVTGIIPRFAAPDAGAAPVEDDFSGMSPEERDRAFESYRNFDDVDVEEPAPRRRRGLFAALRRSGRDDDTTDRPDAAPAADSADDAGSTAHLDLLSGTRVDDRSTDDGQLHVVDDTPTELTDVSEPSWGARAWSGRPDVDAETPAAAVGETTGATTEDVPEEDFAADDVAPAAAATTRFTPRPDAGDDPVVDLDKSQRSSYEARSWRGQADAPAVDGETTDRETTDRDQPAADGPSPAKQWAILGLQVIIGLAVGVGLFLGFTELWRWNVYFALVLAIVVIFGLVTFVHVVRRSSDLVSTLIALAVGLIVTIGPLALLASGS